MIEKLYWTYNIILKQKTRYLTFTSIVKPLSSTNNTAASFSIETIRYFTIQLSPKDDGRLKKLVNFLPRSKHPNPQRNTINGHAVQVDN